MENISRSTGTLSVRGTAAIEGLPFEVLEQILSNLHRSERLAASRHSPTVKKHTSSSLGNLSRWRLENRPI